MVHIYYDFSLVIGSVIVAILACYFAVSIEQSLFRGLRQQYEKILLVISGCMLSAAIWSIHFVGMLACRLPADYSFDYGLTFLSYVIAFIASIFAVWLTTRATLPFLRLVLGAVLTGLGIAGMHYTGMMGLVIDQHEIYYDPLLVAFSVLIAIVGSGLSFWLTFKYKNAVHKMLHIKALIALIMALTLVGMHYMGMASAAFYSIDANQLVSNYKNAQGLILFSIIFVISSILVAAFTVAILEQRLEARNKQLFAANRELANQAVQDNLTRLPNRLFLAEYSHLLFTQHRCRDEKIAFLYINLDRFKAVNDVFGHHVGDQLLVQLAARIQRILAENEKLLRIGSDEFLMVLESASIEHAVEKSEQVLRLIQDSFLIAGKEINISSSIGIAMYPDHGNNLQDLLINADAAMLMSKYQGRNTYSVFNYSVGQQEAKSQTKLINDLYKAVEEKQFILFYQPKFTTKSRKICGVEALIRWNHPRLGLLTPNMFIEGAEKTGLIIQMGYWALEQAFKQIQIWEQSDSNYFPLAEFVGSAI